MVSTSLPASGTRHLAPPAVWERSQGKEDSSRSQTHKAFSFTYPHVGIYPL